MLFPVRKFNHSYKIVVAQPPDFKGHSAQSGRPSAPSPWIERWLGLIPPGGTALDLACGSGRHVACLLRHGCRVVAVDRDIAQLGPLARDPGVEAIATDLESGAGWPLEGRQFDAIVVTNYLHRPLFPNILKALRPGGVLLYETFAAGNERFGKPSNPNFLLRDGELLDVAHAGELHVVAYEALTVESPRPAVIQRIAASARG